MRGFTFRRSSCPSDRKQSRRRDRQEAIEAASSEAVASAIAEDSRSVLDAYVREGARKLLQAALECEVEAFVEEYAVKVDIHGRRLVVRNGYLPARSIMTRSGPLEVEQPRVRDKFRHVEERAFFTSAILPPYLRKSRSVEELIPFLYLKGISTGQFPEALRALLGKDAKGFSPNVVVRLKKKWARSTRRGVVVISRARSTSTSGPTASTSTCGWKTRATRSSACSSLWEPRPKVGMN